MKIFSVFEPRKKCLSVGVSFFSVVGKIFKRMWGYKWGELGFFSASIQCYSTIRAILGLPWFNEIMEVFALSMENGIISIKMAWSWKIYHGFAGSMKSTKWRIMDHAMAAMSMFFNFYWYILGYFLRNGIEKKSYEAY